MTLADRPETPLTRREQQREATYGEIVRVSRALLDEGAELSLRAVASRMGMTAPALYRYVAGYQELVDLVAYEIDRAATDRFEAAIADVQADDAAARLVLSVTEFRMWALASPREFGLAFANPVAEAGCARRELLTLSSSGHLFTDLMREVWEQRRFDVPELADLPASVQEAIREPLIPAKVDQVPEDSLGLVWRYMQGWTRLYGVVALEVFGHCDPRLSESGDLFVDALLSFAPDMGLGDEVGRLETLMRERIARG
ncbi:MAG: hypothetical protein CMH83_10610 [Nocardioides sp.]|nr:hypothetical protein [Nocardioides sp.]